jgi:ABC-type transport system involved in multi-copper enzyme maturation permease subunit
LVRSLSALALIGVVVVAVLVWGMLANGDPTFNPDSTIRISLFVIEGMAIVFGLVLAPALLAGSLAGERERGALPLLLTTNVTPREIVLGRVLGKLSQVVMVLLGGLPALIWVGTLAGLDLLGLVTLLTLPLTVALGLGGLSAAASVMSNRGRDALISVYLIVVLVLLSQLLIGLFPVLEPLSLVNPLSGATLGPMIIEGRLGLAWVTIIIWAGLGVLGLVVAAWRLRPSCIGRLSAASRRETGGRGVYVPEVGERPMLWKELFIERANTLGRFGAVIGVFLVLYLGLGSVVLGGAVAWFQWTRPDSTWGARLSALMSWLYTGGAATTIGFLIEAIVGLRAGVTIASERERNTWDALLTSPLDGRAIVNGKLWGSLYALKWLFLAVLVAWTTSVAVGAMGVREYVSGLVLVLTVSAFLAAIGVRLSLATATATRAMSLTIGAWLAAGIAIFVVSWVIALTLALFWLFCVWMAVQMQLVSVAGGPWAPISLMDLQTVLAAGLYLLATSMVATESRLRFDRIAGRMAGDEAQVAVDEMLHGKPLAPVRIPGFDGRANGKVAAIPEPTDVAT